MIDFATGEQRVLVDGERVDEEPPRDR
jgi:hypothetical protein